MVALRPPAGRYASLIGKSNQGSCRSCAIVWACQQCQTDDKSKARVDVTAMACIRVRYCTFYCIVLCSFRGSLRRANGAAALSGLACVVQSIFYGKVGT